MTVQELIDKLVTLPPTTEIQFSAEIESDSYTFASNCEAVVEYHPAAEWVTIRVAGMEDIDSGEIS